MFSFGAPLTAPCTASAAFSNTAQHFCPLPRRKVRVCGADNSGVSQVHKYENAMRGDVDMRLQVWYLIVK